LIAHTLQRHADVGDALAGARGFIDYWSGAGAFAPQSSG